MNNVQAQKEQQVRILGRQIGREITPEQTESITGGGDIPVQHITGTYSKIDGHWISTTNDGQ